MIVTSRSYHIAHLENNFSHSPWKLSSNIILKIHIKSVVFNILVNLVVFLNSHVVPGTWFGLISPHISVHHSLPFSILGEGCGCSRQQHQAHCLLPPPHGSAEGCLARAQAHWCGQGQVGEPSTERGWSRNWGQSWEGWKLLLLVEIP